MSSCGNFGHTAISFVKIVLISKAIIFKVEKGLIDLQFQLAPLPIVRWAQILRESGKVGSSSDWLLEA